jgi:hypothetical protein
MNLLWLESPIQISTMSSWVTKEGKPWALYHSTIWLNVTVHSIRRFDAALASLTQLHILSSNSATKLGLSAAFKTSMRYAITGGYI